MEWLLILGLPGISMKIGDKGPQKIFTQIMIVIEKTEDVQNCAKNHHGYQQGAEHHLRLKQAKNADAKQI